MIKHPTCLCVVKALQLMLCKTMKNIFGISLFLSDIKKIPWEALAYSEMWTV